MGEYVVAGLLSKSPVRNTVRGSFCFPLFPSPSPSLLPSLGGPANMLLDGRCLPGIQGAG